MSIPIHPRSSEWIAGLASAGVAGVGALWLRAWWQSRARKALAYVDGQPLEITVVGIDGKPVELETARAFRRMQLAAAEAGVRIKVVSGFRTMAEQTRLYDCYVRCDCNDCHLAARPGYSKHQSGQALDLNTRDPAVGAWMAAHAADYGFARTIASEPWHWEHQIAAQEGA